MTTNTQLHYLKTSLLVESFVTVHPETGANTWAAYCRPLERIEYAETPAAAVEKIKEWFQTRQRLAEEERRKLEQEIKPLEDESDAKHLAKIADEQIAQIGRAFCAVVEDSYNSPEKIIKISTTPEAPAPDTFETKIDEIINNGEPSETNTGRKRKKP